MANDQVALLVGHPEEEAEVTSAEENSNAKAASNLNDSNPTLTMEESTVNVEQKFLAMDSFFRKYWKKIFLASCLLAVSLDPLFLYVPTIKDKDDMKCLLMDTTLKITAVFLRTVTDLFYIMDITYQIYSSKELLSRKPLFQAISYSILILVDILAILPLPQVMILIFFSRMRDSKSLNIWKAIMNLLVLSQYIPRIIRIYLSFKELQLSGETEETPTWIKGVLNFFMYVLASHVLGAVWYFFAIQRMTVCWQSGCGNGNGCETSRSFGCHGHNTFKNITFLNDLCLSNSTMFDFGIYSRAFESGIHASENYIQKFSNCLWWGLRNLSSLGSNLEPSVDEWENIFAAFISIIGLFLFLYLIGNLQGYMQLEMEIRLGRRAERIEDHKHRRKVAKRMKKKSGDVERWLAQKGIPKSSNEEIKFCIMEKIRQEVKVDRDVLLDNIFLTLPRDFQTLIENCMPMTRLINKVPMLGRMDKFKLKELSENMKPKKYTKDEVIVQAGKQLEMVLFIVDGFVVTEKGSSNLQQYGAGQSYGEVVVYWLLQRYTEGYTGGSNTVLIATECVRAIGDVEALVLTASDIRSVLSSRSMWHFRGDGSEIEEQLDNHLVHARILKTFVMEGYLDYHAEVITTGAHLTMYTGHAIKRYRDVIASQDRRDNELVVLSVINHENVVKLLGYMEGSEEDSGLVFEYAGLSYHAPKFSFEARMVLVAMDISAALAYLHSCTHNKPLIIHRNVNMGHILVDDRDGKYTAKLVGFGSSKMMPKGQTQTEIAEVALGDDMMGYLDPEFIDSKILTEKVDVYSFGVVLVELLTGQKAYSSEKPEAERNLATFFLSVMEKDGFAEVFDGQALEKEQGFEMARKVADLAKRCLALKGKERPTMEQVHMELKEVTELNMGSREGLPRKHTIKMRIQEKGQEVDQWLFDKFVPQRWNELIKFHIMEKVRQEVEEDREIVGLDHMFYTLPVDLQNCIWSCSPYLN